MQKLSKEQIDSLYGFTRKHFVEYFDVQTELVDHMANDIEAIWIENPNITFENARDKCFKKFGVFGFMNVIEERQKALGKKYMRILCMFAKEWFKLPKFLITVMSVLVLYTLFSIQHIGFYLVYSIHVVFAVYYFVRYKHLKKQYKKRLKVTGKNWMLEEMIFKTSSANFILIFINILDSYRLESMLGNFWFTLGLSCLCILIFLVAYITLTVIPSKAEKLLEETYPEYKIV